MRGDFSRKTFDPTRHYRGVLMQQGRVQLDADWNEQLEIQRHLDTTEASDVIGVCGGPKHGAGFRVEPTPDGTDLIIWPGRFYVHGRLCELESTPVDAQFESTTQVTVSRWHVDGADFAANQWVELSASNNVAPAVIRVETADSKTRRLTFASSLPAAFGTAEGIRLRRLTTYLTQPDLPSPPFAQPSDVAKPPALALADGSYLVYLDVWTRHLTALDDERIREKALGGPDTATRVKVVWQVKLWPGPEGEPLGDDIGCASPVPRWDALVAPSTGRVSFRTKPAPEAEDPCLLPPGAGYAGLENQLYRVEIHVGGTLGADSITFKWSRDNGSVVKAIEKITGGTGFTVHDTGPDDVLGLTNGQWVEQVDETTELQAIARDLFQFQMDSVTGEVTLDYPVDEARRPQLRRWDSEGEVGIPSPPVGDGWIDLENRIQARFELGTYRTGDHWVAPARTVLGDLEWTKDGAGRPVPQPPRGIVHAYCRIAVLKAQNQGAALSVEDCRPLFPPLNELQSTASCCTFTVGDGVTHVGDFTLIQDAVNHLPDEGGEICILPGTYVENVRIERSGVHLKGCGLRTRVRSMPPDPKGVADAVFHLVGSDRTRIESLAIEASESGPGILADGKNRRLVLERLTVMAAGDSGVKVRDDADDVTIERCRLEMIDGNGGWPGIFVQASDATVRENVVIGPLLGRAPADVYRATGALAVSGLQLGGGCDGVRVHDNLFQGCTGQGITLGSLVEEVQQQERPDVLRIPIGWVTDRNDPCHPCEDPTTGDRPQPEAPAGEPTTRLQSEGDLYDIDIRRNRILDIGLDGIGVAHFFDLSRTDRALGLIRVEDLTIAENRIERCVRRGFARIPDGMVDLMAYGGISLPFVEGLVVRDNRIEDLGHGGVLPACGIFVLYGEGVEIARNDVLGGVPAIAIGDAATLPGRRGGIHVVFARALEAVHATMVQDVPAKFAAFVVPGRGPRRADVAAAVEGNTVDVPAGQAISIGALGPVSVVSNRLVSRGLVSRDLVTLLRSPGAQGPGNVLAHLSSLVAIVNLGAPATSSGPANMQAAVSGPAAPRSVASLPAAGSGLVLFDDNECMLDLKERSAATPGAASVLPAVLVMSLQDVGFQDNVCVCRLTEGVMPVATVLLGLWSLRAVSNRFDETAGKAQFSAVTFGLMNMTVLNQATHCLKVLGLPLLRQDQPNHVLLSAMVNNFCGIAQRDVAAKLRLVLG